MRTWGEDRLLQVKERGLRGNQPCECLDLRLLASGMLRQYISVIQTAQSVALCHGSPSGLMQAYAGWQCSRLIVRGEWGCYYKEKKGGMAGGAAKASPKSPPCTRSSIPPSQSSSSRPS